VAGYSRQDALVRTKRLWLFVATLAFAFGGMGPAIAAAFYAVAGHPAMWGLVVGYYVALVALFRAWTTRWEEERGALRADETGLWLGARCVLRRDDVSHAYVLRRSERTYVRFGRLLRHVEVEVEEEAEGEKLLAAMRLDSGRSVAQYRLNHGTWRASFLRAAASTLPVLVAPAVAFLLGGTPQLLLAALLVGSTLTCAYAFNQFIRLSIGADGIRMRRLLGRSRFIPFSSIESAVTDGKDITIHLHGGEILRTHQPQGRSRKGAPPIRGLTDREQEPSKLVERIDAQLAVRRARENADAPAFGRAGRSTDEWLREVAGATDAQASYRKPAVPPDELWRIVEDTAAAPTARAGAAVALREALDEPGRVRLRAAADACAAPRLRIALETVASPSDDLRHAFDELDDHDVATRRMHVGPRK
jgi:hypothetical protein